MKFNKKNLVKILEENKKRIESGKPITKKKLIIDSDFFKVLKNDFNIDVNEDEFHKAIYNKFLGG